VRGVAYVDDPLPNIVHIAIWMPAYIVWLYYASLYTCGFWEKVSCLVCRLSRVAGHGTHTRDGALHLELV
jgi:hypothetical protein